MSCASADLAVRTRIWIRARSPLLMPPNNVITRSWVSDPGSTAPPTSGTQQSDAVVREHREGERELRPVERASRFADHDGIEATVATGHIGKQP